MFKIERISNDIAARISSELGLDNDRRDVLAYGAFALFQIILSIVLVAIVGIIFNVVVEALIVSFTGAILRKYSGGVHASTPDRCLIIGTLVSVGLAISFSNINQWTYINMVLASGLITFIWAYYIVNKLAPVDSSSKPIKNEGKKRRMKKGSILVLSVYAICVLLLLVMYYSGGGSKLLVYSFCIYGGIVSQTFSLTKTGHFIMNKVDTFLNQIFFRKDDKYNEKAN